MTTFSHLDAAGNPAMVNVSEKPATLRSARARAIVVLPEMVLQQLEGGDIRTAKGPVFQTAIIAGVMAAKKTGELIPLCHPLGLEDCQLRIRIGDDHKVYIDCTATVTGKTGVEMEAMTGASVAALTIYDMCKAFTHDIAIESIVLMEKSGGKRDFKREDG